MVVENYITLQGRETPPLYTRPTVYTANSGVTWNTYPDSYWFEIYGNTYYEEEEGGQTVAASSLFPTETYISGYITRFQKRQIVGYYWDSGDLRSVEVNASGHIKTDVEVEVSSGQHVVVSGQPVTISGDHVFVESGVYLATGSVILDHYTSDITVYPATPEWNEGTSGVVIAGSISGCWEDMETNRSGFGIKVGNYGWDQTEDHWTAIAVDTLGKIIIASGCFIASGIGVLIQSGAGVLARITSGEFSMGTTNIFIQSMIPISSKSGGTQIMSSDIQLGGGVFRLKNISGNNDMFLGDDNRLPYSGYGYLLSMDEVIEIKHYAASQIYACANTSGQKLTYWTEYN